MFISFPISKLVPAAALSLVLGLPAVVSGDTITVCWDGSGDYLTIQEGIDAAEDGDEVVVCDGVYTGPGNKNLDFGGRAITVRSENGPDNCIIDCEGDGRGFHFHSGETGDAVVDGFTITNGYGAEDSGGAIYCDGSSPTITNCVITGNSTWDAGGGVFSYDGSPIISDCTLTRNSALGYGSGIYCEYGSPVISNCTLTDNTAGYCPEASGGWAVCCVYGSPTITDCTISENTGGGVACAYGSATVSGCMIAENVVGENVACAGVSFGEGTFTLTDCTISGNRSGWAAGGVGCFYSSEVTIDNCTITGNTVKEGTHAGGGGVYCRESSPVISNCTISNNTVQGGWDASGGGIYSDAGDPTISNCMVAENSAADGGGGIYCVYGDPTITDCTIAGNTAGFGGGIYCAYDSTPTITNCTVAGNTAGFGGGICCGYSNPTITNCLITGNTAQSDDYAARGGGVHCDDNSSSTIVNCAIVGNAAVGDGAYGGAISCRYDSNPTIANCILWGDSAAHGPEIAVVDGATLTVSYSDVEGGQAGVYQDGTLNWGDGNIDADPVLAFAADPHLMPGSPCIDAGTNDPPGGLPPEDPDGNPRPLDGDGDSIAIADMGAYEFNPDAPSIGCSPIAFEFCAYKGGPTPDDHVLSLRNCGVGTLEWEILEECSWLEVDPTSGQSAGEIDEVILSLDVSELSHGTHTCTLDITDPQAVNSPRTVRVTLRLWSGYPTIQSLIDDAEEGDVVLIADGVYAGPGNRDLDFNGKAITLRSENGPQNCVIDCERAGRGFYFHSSETPETILDGFTITNGDGGFNGGGIYCVQSSPTITNCVIVGNRLDRDHGGGIWCSGSPTITNCTIVGNRAGWYGGGICCSAETTIANCTIAENSGCEGGGIRCTGSTTVTNCAIVDNWGAAGGAVTCSGNARITNCTVVGNSVVYSGGGIYCHDSTTIANCVIAGNFGPDGAGLCCDYGEPTVINCAIVDNTGLSGAGISCAWEGSAVITNCTIAGNTAVEHGGGIACDDRADAAITNCVLWGNLAPQGQEIWVGFTYQPSTLTVRYCDVQGGEDEAYVDDGSTLNWGVGNIDGDPLFVDPDNDDFHLAAGSPCIDAGDNEAVPEGVTTDLDANPRFIDDPDTQDTGNGEPPIVDMGAYEYQIPGDLNGDGCVDFSDLGILLSDWQCSGGDCPGDCDGDGDTDHADLGILLAYWGAGCP